MLFYFILTEAETPKLEKHPPSDDFEQLRVLREKERIERQKQKIARSVSQQGTNLTFDTDLILEQLANSRGDGINRNSYIDPSTT